MFSIVLIFAVNSIVKTYIDSINQTEPCNSYIDDVIVYIHYFDLSPYEDGINGLLANMLIKTFLGDESNK